jgi:hypothetical protein
MSLIVGNQIVVCETIFYPFQCPQNKWEDGEGRIYHFFDGDLPENPVFCWQICLAEKGECVFKDNYKAEEQEDYFAVFC